MTARPLPGRVGRCAACGRDVVYARPVRAGDGPHPGYRHYAAFPWQPDRFWTWDDKHPEFPCPTVDCPGDGRYVPPGRGHYDGCTYLILPGDRAPRSYAEQRALLDDSLRNIPSAQEATDE